MKFLYEGVEYIAVTREEAVLSMTFPKRERLMLAINPSMKFIIGHNKELDLWVCIPEN